MPLFARSRVLFLCALAAGCSSPIQHGLDERDANEVVSVLTARGFDARKVAEKGKKPTWAIEVGDERATEALRVLTELKLPRAPKLTTAKIASETALIETPTGERLRQLEGQEGDLEQALETLGGVTSASVELVVPPAPRLGVAPSASKASVLLRVRADAFDHLQQQRAELKALVAGAVEGLQPDDVVLVIDEVVTTTKPEPEPPAPSPMAERMLKGAVVVLGCLLTLLAFGLMALATRLRQLQKTTKKAAPGEAVAPAPAATPSMRGKPVIAANVQRKSA